MKSKFKSKNKVQDENQQLVMSKCEETFEKLNKLHQDLDGIQKVRHARNTNVCKYFEGLLTVKYSCRNW